MKYLSLIILIIIMGLSWRFAYNKSPFSDYVHQQLQNEIKRHFASYIQKKIPNVESIVFKKLWTQNVKKNHIRAYFEYSFREPQKAQTTLQGSVLLHRTEPKGEQDNWKMGKINLSKNHVVFEDGLDVLAE